MSALTADRDTRVLRPTRRRRIAPNALTYVALFLISFIIVVPLLWMLLTSFKTDYDAISAPASPLPNPFTTEAYTTLAEGNLPILRWLANSLIAATGQTLIIMITASASVV
jgi:multiple sugar transport system permease protein